MVATIDGKVTIIASFMQRHPDLCDACLPFSLDSVDCYIGQAYVTFFIEKMLRAYPNEKRKGHLR